ncbi:MAG: NUDIX domain-containing protein [Pseudobutyrivibrio sp.]|nr:NUDIX domain-containing protein [Pseudobutyrivibrio sp.]
MKQLLTLDAGNYEECTGLLEKVSTRGIIFRGDKIAMQRDAAGIYKIPGGGVEANESYIQALIREVAEETGLIIIEESIREIGEITELRQDIFEPDKKFVRHNLFYFAQVKDVTVPLKMTDSEKERGFHLHWATLEEIYNTNMSLISHDLTTPDKDMIFIKMLLDSEIKMTGQQ